MDVVDPITCEREDLSGGFMSGFDQVKRPRVVPLRRVGSSYCSTPLGEFVFYWWSTVFFMYAVWFKYI